MTDVKESDLVKAINNRWGQGNPPRHVVAVQVNNGAGYSYGRTIDAIVLNTWPSDGLSLQGLEIKTSRADYRRELRNPQKFRDFKPYLDRFSIVAPKGVIQMDILPNKWGAYVLTDDQDLHTLRAPLPLHDDFEPTVNRHIFAAFARALVQRSLSDEAIEAAEERGRERAERRAQMTIERLEDKAEQWESAVEEFEQASGVKISRYSGQQIGEAVQFVLSGGLKTKLQYKTSLRDVGERLISLADELEELQANYERMESE